MGNKDVVFRTNKPHYSLLFCITLYNINTLFGPIVTILVMMAIMLVMAIITVHIPNVLPNGSQWCTQLLATLLFVMICICVIIIVRQPRHRPLSRYGMPCMPLLPICSIWLDIHLIVCLQYNSWLAFLIWTLFGENDLT